MIIDEVIKGKSRHHCSFYRMGWIIIIVNFPPQDQKTIIYMKLTTHFVFVV